MDDGSFRPGRNFILQKGSPGADTALFSKTRAKRGISTLSTRLTPDTIVDAVHIYNVSNIVDRERPSIVSIVWSTDESKCALLINDYPHAVFDFVAKRGFCRSNFPNFANQIARGWSQSDHGWSEDAVLWLKAQQP